MNVQVSTLESLEKVGLNRASSAKELGVIAIEGVNDVARVRSLETQKPIHLAANNRVHAPSDDERAQPALRCKRNRREFARKRAQTQEAG